MTLISTLMIVALTAGPALPASDSEILQIESELVIRGRVRKPQVFFVLPKSIADMGEGTLAEVSDPIDEVIRVGAVNLAPGRDVDLTPFANASLLGKVKGALR